MVLGMVAVNDRTLWSSFILSSLFSSSFRLFIILLVVAIQVSVASMVLDVKAKPITLGASALVLE